MFFQKKSKRVIIKLMKYIDIHIHGGYGVNFNTSGQKEIRELLRELYLRNIVAICPTLVGDDFKNLQERFKLFRELKSSQKHGESKILGLHLEGTFLNPKKPGIQDCSVFMTPDVENFKKLAQGYCDIIKIVTYAPELDKNNAFAKYLEENNIKAHAGHTLATNKGCASATTHHFNAMPNMAHRGENLALDGLFDDNLYCEIIADLKHVESNMLKLFFALKSPDKIIMVSDALPAAHCSNEVIFCGKKINKYGKDDNGVLAGSVMFLDEIVNNVTDKGIITKYSAEKYVFYNVLHHLGISENDI